MLKDGLYPCLIWSWMYCSNYFLTPCQSVILLTWKTDWNIREAHLCFSCTPREPMLIYLWSNQWKCPYQLRISLASLKLSTCVMNKEQEQWNTGARVCGEWADLRSSSFLANTLEMRCFWNALLKILLYFVLTARFLSGGLEQFLCLELTFHSTMQMERKWTNID